MKKNSLALTRIYALLVIVLGILYFYMNFFCPRFIPSFLRIGIIRQPFNLLILGTDNNFDVVTNKYLPNSEGRTDSILLAHVDPIRGRINILSIPRDTLVTIPGYGQQKINAANVYGGIELTKIVIQDLTGQKVDHYIKIKPSAIPSLVNLIGGVVIFVEKDMRYTDHAQRLDINLKQGWHRLSGKEAHDYIRFRHDEFGDIGRIDRQQKFFKALMKQAAAPSNILKAPIAIGIILREIETDLSLSTTVRLFNFFRMLSFSNLKTSTVAGEATDVPGAGSVWIANQDELKKIVREFFQ